MNSIFPIPVTKGAMVTEELLNTTYYVNHVFQNNLQSLNTTQDTYYGRSNSILSLNLVPATCSIGSQLTDVKLHTRVRVISYS
jgi:hypothetical protein